MGYYIFLGIIILYCVAQLRQGQILASTVLVLFTLCINVYTAVSGIARDVQRFDYGLASLERQRDFLNKIEKQRPDGPLSLKDCRSENEEVVFEIRDLCFSYQDGNDIIRNLNLKIKKGETIAIVGKNGSGKSTLVKLLVGLFIPQKGEFFFKGVPVQQNREYVRRKTAIFFRISTRSIEL
ncbi:MAG: ABC transporter ATP-binding protein/permease [Oscillospiraceae bacterium]